MNDYIVLNKHDEISQKNFIMRRFTLNVRNEILERILICMANKRNKSTLVLVG
jgi:hypothetical protein